MRLGRKKSLWIWVAVAAGVICSVIFLYHRRKPVVISGVVTVDDADPRKQLPIADVAINAGGLAENPTKSDASGFFSLTLRKRVIKGERITLRFKHPNYEPSDVAGVADDKIYIVRMDPLHKKPDNGASHPKTSVANVRVRYSIKAMRTMNVGSAVNTFQVENTGNTPCKGRNPCSPDGKWKATVGSTTLDAGVGNEFRNARVSCIAGPCPFTKIESDEFLKAAQKITVSARNWSDTATFLVEAEVVHTMQSQIDHQSYPVIFGSALNFTLPTDAEGVSLEADISGETIIFPLGPDLFLSWAECNSKVNPDHTSVYRCALKQGYQFQ